MKKSQFVIGILLLVLFSSACSSKTSKRTRTRTKKTAVNNSTSLEKYKTDIHNLNLVSTDNEVITLKKLLSKHKGKVIYIDLWASWCMPCLVQMPSSKRLKQELEGEPVEFVYLSTDLKTNLWIRTSQREQIPTSNNYLILNPATSKLFESWNVYGIPRYLIYDKQGQMVVTDAPRPSESSARDMLRMYAKH